MLCAMILFWLIRERDTSDPAEVEATRLSMINRHRWIKQIHESICTQTQKGTYAKHLQCKISIPPVGPAEIHVFDDKRTPREILRVEVRTKNDSSAAEILVMHRDIIDRIFPRIHSFSKEGCASAIEQVHAIVMEERRLLRVVR